MTLILKLMSGEPMPDEDTRKSYSIRSGIVDFGFERVDGVAYLWLYAKGCDPERVPLNGNVYVMNEAGKTVSSFGIASPDPRGELPRREGDLIVLPKEIATDIRATLDAMGVALADHLHVWTPELRRAFELSIKSLGGVIAKTTTAKKVFAKTR